MAKFLLYDSSKFNFFQCVKLKLTAIHPFTPKKIEDKIYVMHAEHIILLLPRSNMTGFSCTAFAIFMTRPTKLEGHYVFALSVRPECKKKWSKNTFYRVFSMFWVFLEISTFVRPSIRLAVRPGSGWAMFCAENLFQDFKIWNMKPIGN